MNHDLIGGKFSNGGDLLPKELNKAGNKHQNKHIIIRVPTNGRSQENSRLWNQDKDSWG